MIMIPAIDILDGQCVRLYKGDYEKSTVYPKDPVETAREFYRQGAERIHIVDLGAARGGANSRRILKEIRRAVPLILETGGGIRTKDDVEELLNIGIDRLILGTLLVREPQTAAAWIGNYGRVFIAGIDALQGYVRIAGWEESSGLEDHVLAQKAADMGFVSIIYTNIEKDGTLEGPDLAATERIARAAGLPVILSGGVSSLEDIRQAASSPGAKSGAIRGIITGKALYEGRFTLPEALTICGREKTPEEESLW